MKRKLIMILIILLTCLSVAVVITGITIHIVKTGSFFEPLSGKEMVLTTIGIIGVGILSPIFYFVRKSGKN